MTTPTGTVGGEARGRLRVVIIALILLALVPSLIAGLVILRDGERLRADLVHALSLQIGLKVEFVGPISAYPGWRPTVRAERVEVGARPGSDGPPLARFETILFEIDLPESLRERRLVISAVELEDVALHLMRDAEGRGNWTADRRLTTRAPDAGALGLEFEVRSVVFDRVDIEYTSATSDIGFELSIPTLRIDRADTASPLDVAGAVVVFGDEVGFEARLGDAASVASSKLFGSGRHALAASFTSGDARFYIDGWLEDPRGAARAELGLAMDVSRPGTFGAWRSLGMPSAVFAPLHAHARATLVGGEDLVRLDDLDVTLEFDASTRLRARGKLADLPRLSGLTLALEATSEDLDGLLAGFEPRPAGPIRMLGTSRLAEDGDGWRLEDFDLELGFPGAVQVAANGHGRIGVAGVEHVELSTSLRAADLGRVFDLYPDALGLIAQDGADAANPAGAATRVALRAWLRGLSDVSAAARVSGGPAGLRLDAIDIRAGARGVGWLEADGTAAQIWPGREGVSVAVEVGAESAAELAPYFEGTLAKLDRLSGSGTLQTSAAGLVLASPVLEARMGEHAHVVVRAKEAIELAAPMARWLDAELVSPGLRALGEVFDLDLPASGAVSLRGRVSLGEVDWRAEDLEGTIGGTRLTGAVDYAQPERGRARLHARLHSPRISVVDLGLVAGAAALETNTSTNATAPAGGPTARGILEATWPSPGSDHVDWALDLSAGAIVGLGSDVENVVLSFETGRAAHVLESLRFEWMGGVVAAKGRMAGAAPDARVELDVRARGLDLASLVEAEDEGDVATGSLDFRAVLSGSGTHLGAVLEGADGWAFVHARDGRVATRYSEALELDLIAGVSSAARTRAYEQYACMIADLSAVRGRYTINDLLFDSEYKQVLGAGAVDLAAQELDVVLTPKLRESSTGKVAAAVRVSGPVSEPKVRVVPLETAGVTTRGLLDQALNPLRLALPGVMRIVDDAREAAEEVAGAAVPEQLWRRDARTSCADVLARSRARDVGPLSESAPLRPSARTTR